jgi:hypothetical protein
MQSLQTWQVSLQNWARLATAAWRSNCMKKPRKLRLKMVQNHEFVYKDTRGRAGRSCVQTLSLLVKSRVLVQFVAHGMIAEVGVEISSTFA